MLKNFERVFSFKRKSRKELLRKERKKLTAEQMNHKDIDKKGHASMHVLFLYLFKGNKYSKSRSNEESSRSVSFS